MKKIVLSLIAVLVAVATFAQVTTSGISGLVTDNASQPLIGATVIAVHTPSGTTYGVSSNNDGRYTINGVRSGGPYTVTISYVGYQSLETTGIMLSLGENYALNAKLPEGQSIDEVVISVSAFDAHKTGSAMNFTAASIESTPTVSRSVYDIVEMSPLANSSGSGVSFAGSNNRYNSFQIDGAVSNDVFGLSSSGTNGGQTGSNPVALDAIEELQVVVAPFDVRQSGFTGGGINAVTKAGTNEIKGSAYAYYSDENIYGTTAGELDEGEEREKADEFTSSTLGVTIGGPIIKDKLFAFVSFERTREVEPVLQTPGYASDYLSEETAQAILNKYQEYTGISDTYGNHETTAQQSYDLMTRIDWNINQDHKFMFRYQFKDAYNESYSTSNYSYTYDGSGFFYTNKTHSFVAELNSRFSNNLSNEFRATLTTVRDKRDRDYLGPRVAIYNVDWGVDSDGDAQTGTVNLGTNVYAGANAVNTDVWTITDNVSLFKGDHSLTFGTHNEIYKIGNTYIPYSTGYYTYNSLEDFYNDMANYYSYAYAVDVPNDEYMPIMNAAQFGFYAQDEWKPNTDLTLTYGLRVDIPVIFNNPPVNEEFNAIDELTNNGEYQIGTMPKTHILWSPRVGFRYNLDDEGKQLLRGGAGIFTGRVPFVWLHNAFSYNGVDKKSVTNYSTKDSDGNVVVSAASIDQTSTAGSVGKETVNTISEDFKMPQVFRANLAYEHRFDNGWKLSLEGLFTQNINNVAFRNLAISDEGDKFFAVSADDATSANTSVYYTKISSDYANVINLENTNHGYSYNLTAMVEKRFAMGLNLMASYTFGHAYSVNDGSSSVATSNWQYNYSVNSNDMDEMGYASFDNPHVVKASINYTTPLYGNGRWSTNVGLTYNGSAGGRYDYFYDSATDVNNDGSYYSLMYIPTNAEIEKMTWDTDESKASFKEWLASDEYASSHQGQFADRYAGLSRFEHHFNLHLAQNFIYNKEKGSRIEVSCDIINIGNLLNREWGMKQSTGYGTDPLKVKTLTEVDGGYVPTYTWNDPTEFYDTDFSSRWYMQVGARVTF